MKYTYKCMMFILVILLPMVTHAQKGDYLTIKFDQRDHRVVNLIQYTQTQSDVYQSFNYSYRESIEGSTLECKRGIFYGYDTKIADEDNLVMLDRDTTAVDYSIAKDDVRLLVNLFEKGDRSYKKSQRIATDFGIQVIGVIDGTHFSFIRNRDRLHYVNNWLYGWPKIQVFDTDIDLLLYSLLPPELKDKVELIEVPPLNSVAYHHHEIEEIVESFVNLVNSSDSSGMIDFADKFVLGMDELKLIQDKGLSHIIEDFAYSKDSLPQKSTVEENGRRVKKALTTIFLDLQSEAPFSVSLTNKQIEEQSLDPKDFPGQDFVSKDELEKEVAVLKFKITNGTAKWLVEIGQIIRLNDRWICLSEPSLSTY